jgi:hypothetical protein
MAQRNHLYCILDSFAQIGDYYAKAAVHEAGHALIMRRNGGRNIRCHVNLGGKRRGGSAGCDNMRSMSAYKQLQILAAGAAAEVVIRGQFELPGLRSDMRMARGLGYTDDQFFEVVWEIADNITKDEILAVVVGWRDYR